MCRHPCIHPRDRSELIGALSDTDESVRGAAHEALRGLTGLDLPADPFAWRKNEESTPRNGRR